MSKLESSDYYKFLRVHANVNPWDIDRWIDFHIVQHETGKPRGICKPLVFDTTVPAGLAQ